MITVYKLIIC